MPALSKDRLEAFYHECNCRRFVHPDPLEFLYAYGDPRDRELVGLIASALAYGRVAQILKSVSGVLGPMGPSPCHFLLCTPSRALRAIYGDFKHRFTTGEELLVLLQGAKNALAAFGSLEACFLAGYRDSDDTILPALNAFVKTLLGRKATESRNSLLPLPDRGSACKRLNLFMRWMVRKDAVDPGGWDRVPLAKLIIPLDTHMHRISRIMGFTRRGQADVGTAIEVTRAFRRFVPEDPVRYDFVLTRLGIRKDMDMPRFLRDSGLCGYE